MGQFCFQEGPVRVESHAERVTILMRGFSLCFFFVLLINLCFLSRKLSRGKT